MATGIDLTARNDGVRPQDDLFRHVNGTWLDTHVIPEDRASDGTFHQLRDQSEERVKALLDALAATDHEAGTEMQQVGDLFASFMDTERIEALDAEPIAADLAAIAALDSTTDLARLLGRFVRTGGPGVFALAVYPDATDPTRYGLYLGQAGLGLPDEAFYRDEQYAPIREAYRDHVATMLGLVDTPDPEAAADRVLALETRIASHHWDNVRDRDAQATYNPVDRAGLDALSPGFDWNAWADGLGVDPALLDAVIVREPSFLEGAAALLGDTDLDDWKLWLTWHTVHEAAALLSDRFVDANFAFYGTTLTGAETLRDRWKRGVGAVESGLGEALGKLYVAEHFPAEAKDQMLVLVGHLIEAYRRSITDLPWMTEETKARALEKLGQFRAKVGYPDRWRDYTGLDIRSDDLVGNLARVSSFEVDRHLGRVGGPVDLDEWLMSPQTVNAYYNPTQNEIVFPAAILQPPFFDPDADDAVNYGAIGAVIGHEIGHGFDDQGSRYDGTGALVDWWTDEDRAAFEERTAKLIAQYDALEPRQTPGNHVNGAFTVGENIGDLGGLEIAHQAYRILTEGQDVPVLDGLTGEQRFFWAWAQAWRTRSRDAEVLRLLAIDPHSPPEFRCNQIVRNIDGFHAAFDLGAEDDLWLEPAERVSIW
jgi:putative endopeptidase